MLYVKALLAVGVAGWLDDGKPRKVSSKKPSFELVGLSLKEDGEDESGGDDDIRLKLPTLRALGRGIGVGDTFPEDDEQLEEEQVDEFEDMELLLLGSSCSL